MIEVGAVGGVDDPFKPMKLSGYAGAGTAAALLAPPPPAGPSECFPRSRRVADLFLKEPNEQRKPSLLCSGRSGPAALLLSSTAASGERSLMKQWRGAFDFPVMGGLRVESSDAEWSVRRRIRRSKEKVVTVKLHAITFDCVDPQALAQFWAKVLGQTLTPRTSPGSRRSVWARTARSTCSRSSTAFPLAATGPTRTSPPATTKPSAPVCWTWGSVVTEVKENDTRFTTFTDPEGNKFDLADE
ncbi:VOC family protein [Actinacidiphila glaucinigra]|uniref:VOC family protein n=1 Tax=Actinacidiphila glaucinigra TaxID=235986 RepID=UPI0033BB9AFE